MTALLAPLVFLLSRFSGAPLGPSGIYQAPSAPAANWQINENHALIWDGQPYLPVGVRINGNPDAIKMAKSAGIEDVIVELPASGAGWGEAFEALESSHMRYLIAITSLAPMAKGISIEPGGYRFDGITERQHIDISLPGTVSVLAVLATKRDGAVESTTRVQTPDGHLEMDVKPLNDLEHVLIIYPEQTSLVQPDSWEELDKHRDMLMGAFRKSPPGKGLRGIVDPLGAILRLRSLNARFVPTNAYFQLEFATYLETKYRNVQTAMKTWSMASSDVDSFERMARLVPLWAGGRGISELWDPTTDKLYTCDSRTSLVWRDLTDTISTASDRRFKRLVASIRSLANVPIIQDWAGWAAAYESSDSALDGVGVRTRSTSPSLLADEAGRAVSTILRWTKPGWAPATRVDIGAPKDYSQELGSILDDLTSIGARGWFVKADDLAAMKAVAEEAAKRSSNSSIASDSPRPVYFPESAANPASTQRLPGGSWWLPSPAPGNRIDLGSHFFAYRIQESGGSSIAIWGSGEPKRVRLRVLEPKLLKFRSLDGIDPLPKLNKTGVEVRISQTPLIITGSEEIPVPELAVLETAARFDQLSKLAESKLTDISDDRYYYQDNLAGFERNPGGSFSLLRNVIDHLSLKLGSYSWAEGETPQTTNFSEPIQVPGCSGGAALSLATSLSGRQYFAEYDTSVRSRGDQEVWIAARIPVELRSKVRVTVGGQVMPLGADGVSPYGLGYAWYKCGSTKLAGSRAKVRIEVDSANGVDLAIDAIVIYPGEFRPNGISLPEGN